MKTFSDQNIYSQFEQTYSKNELKYFDSNWENKIINDNSGMKFEAHEDTSGQSYTLQFSNSYPNEGYRLNYAEGKFIPVDNV
mgnify:CR=1 FL=1